MADIKTKTTSNWKGNSAVKVWDGSQWTSRAASYWDGSQWVPFTVGQNLSSDGGYPLAANMINVKDYGAVGDGTTDDTAAFVAAMQQAAFNPQFATNFGRWIYVPNGTYLVSDRIDWRAASGVWSCSIGVQGQSQAGTIMKLKDNCAGYQSTASPKPIFATGNQGGVANGTGAGNEAFYNFIRDMTIDVGTGNPGAVGIDLNESNVGGIRNMTIQSSDPTHQGWVGLQLTRSWPGPGLVDNVTIDGFQYAIDASSYQYSMTFEHITLRNQTTACVRSFQQILVFRNVNSVNTVPFYVTTAGPSMLTIIDSTLAGGDPSTTAIDNTIGGFAHVRNTTITGYQYAIGSRPHGGGSGTIYHLTPAQLDALPEFVEGTPTQLFPGATTSLNLTVKEAPTYVDNDINNWANIQDYGAGPATSKTASQNRTAIQAALDSGKSTVYFPSGVNTGGDTHSYYFINGGFTIPATVKRLIGFQSILQPSGWPASTNVFAVAPRTDPLFLDSMHISGSLNGGSVFDYWSSATLVMRDTSMSGGNMSLILRMGCGEVYLNCCYTNLTMESGTKVWARSLNCEDIPTTLGGPGRLYNNGGDLWILCYKTERYGTVLTTTGGGRSEVLGGYHLPTSTSTSDPAFVNVDSQHSLTYGLYAFQAGATFSTQVQETQAGTTLSLTNTGLPQRLTNSPAVVMHVGRL